MAKKALVILAEGFEEIEAITAVDILRRATVDVTVAGLNGLEIKGSRGAIVKADQRLDDVPDDFDACVLPGGMPGATNLAVSSKVKDIIIQMHNNGKIIAAICASPAVVLASFGILENKSATCYPGMEGKFGAQTTFKEDKVVIDGNIITSRGPATAMAFALAIAEALAGKEMAQRVSKATLFS